MSYTPSFPEALKIEINNKIFYINRIYRDVVTFAYRWDNIHYDDGNYEIIETIAVEWSYSLQLWQFYFSKDGEEYAFRSYDFETWEVTQGNFEGDLSITPTYARRYIFVNIDGELYKLFNDRTVNDVSEYYHTFNDAVENNDFYIELRYRIYQPEESFYDLYINLGLQEASYYSKKIFTSSWQKISSIDFDFNNIYVYPMELEKNTKRVSEGFSIGSQTLIDDRTVTFNRITLQEEINSGLAFRLPVGQGVWVQDTNTLYIWQEKREDISGFLEGNFTYPDNIITKNYDYSNKEFNFYPLNFNVDTPLLNKHYIGEFFEGGIIFYLWFDSSGVEHGLIVGLNDLSISHAWSDVNATSIGITAQSSWNGLSNSNAIVSQVGHTSSAAKLCLDSTADGQTDWYLPAHSELKLLFANIFLVQQGIAAAGGTTLSFGSATRYWSSSEINATQTWAIINGLDTYEVVNKSSLQRVRAIRKF